MKKIIKTIICFLLVLCSISINKSIKILANDYRDELSGSGFNDIENEGKTREVYSSLYREATYRLYDDGNGALYTASSRQGYNFNVNGEIIYGGSLAIRELINVGNQKIFIRGTTKIYSEPFAESKFDLGSIPSGHYSVTRQSLDFYEIEYNGRKIWAEPDIVSYYQGTYSFLNTDNINGIPINTMICNFGESIRPGIAMKPQYVTIHNTANEGWGATAKNHASFLYNGESRKDFTSWHFTVDNNEIWQSLPMDESGFHAGDGFSMGNTSTIGIEIAENADGNYQQAEKNAAGLTAYILKVNGLPADAVVMHQYWSGKHCAHNILDGTKNSMGWDAFKAEVKRVYDTLQGVDSISINPTSATLSQGKTFELKTYIKPTNVTSDISFTSSNSKVATVNSDGKVTAVSSGSATITATTENGKSANCIVKVIPQPTSITTNPISLAIVTGSSYRIKTYIQPSTANQIVTYSSNNPNIATIDENGNIKAKGLGSTTINITASNGLKKDFPVTVYPKIAINPSQAKLSIGKNFQAKSLVTPTGLTNSVVYSSSNPSILEVTKSGNVTSIAAGEAYIYATVGGLTQKALVTVIPNAESISFNPSSATVYAGTKFKAKAYVKPVNTNQNVKYSSSDTKIATIDNNGNINTIAPGTVSIFAEAQNGIRNSFNITVLAK